MKIKKLIKNAKFLKRLEQSISYNEIRLAVGFDNLPNVIVNNVDVAHDSIKIDFNLNDDMHITDISGTIELLDSDYSLIRKHSIKIGNNEIMFNELNENKGYIIKVSIYYNAQNGSGYKNHELASLEYTTARKVDINISNINNTSVNYTVNFNQYLNAYFSKVELYQNSILYKVVENNNLIEDLDSNTEYEIVIYYFIANDQEQKTYIYGQKFTTLI